MQAVPWDRAFLALKARFGAALFGRSIHVDGEQAGETDIRAVVAGAGCRLEWISRRPPAIEDAFLRAAEAFALPAETVGATGVRAKGD